MINYEDINKPAFYAYQYLNKLGNREIQDADQSSWACKDGKGNVQLLLWDFTNTHPGDSVSNQVYYKRNLPSKDKGEVSVSFKNLPAGNYKLKIYKTGYHANDPYTSYMELGSPSQLTKAQVQKIKASDDGEPIMNEKISVSQKVVFSKLLHLRENDVFLLTITKI